VRSQLKNGGQTVVVSSRERKSPAKREGCAGTLGKSPAYAAHAAVRLMEFGLANVVAFFLLKHNATQQLSDFLV